MPSSSWASCSTSVSFQWRRWNARCRWPNWFTDRPPDRLPGSLSAFSASPHPKTLGAGYWGSETLSAGKIAYAATDSILAWLIGSYLHPRFVRSRYKVAYGLQRD